MSIKKSTILFFLLANALLSSAKLSGPWHGEVQAGMQQVPVVFNFEEKGDTLTATVDSPLQGAKGIPADAYVKGDSLVVSVPLIGAKFSGAIKQESIQGTFSQSGLSFKLMLEPGEYVPKRPQTPTPPFPYETREVEFINPVDSAVLSGTLSLPIQYSMPFFKDFPLVVFVTGSGAQNRDEEIMGHKPFAVLADFFAKNGIASLRYDDRGYGKSTGNGSEATTLTFASDAQAGIDYARNNVDKVGKIGIIGHSEGGVISYMLAEKGIPDFIVSLAGPAVSGDSIILTQNASLLKGTVSDEILQQYLEGLRRMLKFIVSTPSVKESPELDILLSDLTALPDGMRENLKQIVATRNPWWEFFISYNPTEAISKIKVPVFALNGTLDKQVDAETNLKALSDNLPYNIQNKILAYPNLNHLFQHAKTGMPNEYGLIQETISEEVVKDIINWIHSIQK